MIFICLVPYGGRSRRTGLGTGRGTVPRPIPGTGPPLVPPYGTIQRRKDLLKLNKYALYAHIGLEKRRETAKGINHPKQYVNVHIVPVVPLVLSGVNKRLTEPMRLEEIRSCP